MVTTQPYFNHNFYVLVQISRFCWQPYVSIHLFMSEISVYIWGEIPKPGPFSFNQDQRLRSRTWHWLWGWPWTWKEFKNVTSLQFHNFGILYVLYYKTCKTLMNFLWISLWVDFLCDFGAKSGPWIERLLPAPTWIIRLCPQALPPLSTDAKPTLLYFAWTYFPVFVYVLTYIFFWLVSYLFSCPEQLNRWPCHWLTHWLTVLYWLTYKERP